jgi:DNA-directed RNA polymerase subunit RPC12/RpoP
MLSGQTGFELVRYLAEFQHNLRDITMRITCPECDHRFRIADDDTHQRIKCPECSERFRLSDLEDENERPSKKSKTTTK